MWPALSVSEMRGRSYNPAAPGCRFAPSGLQRSLLQLLEQRISARDLDLAGRFLDVELLHHAVIDQHGITTRARAEPIARAVEGKIDRLGEIAVTVGQEGEHAGGGLLLPGVHDKHVIHRYHRNGVDALR